MSRVYFHSPSDGTAELRGSERAHMRLLAYDLAFACFHTDFMRDNDPLFASVPPSVGLYSSQGDRFRQRFRTWLSVGEGGFLVDGLNIDKDDLVLNTALAIGGDPLRLFVRLHAQCEIHTWVEGPDRAWLAGIIGEGLGTGIMRPHQGWDDVQRLLLRRDDEPVVTSFSGTDTFPSVNLAGWDEEPDDWYDVPADVQWTRAMEGLRKIKGLRLNPQRWKFPAYWFGTDQRTALNLFDP